MRSDLSSPRAAARRVARSASAPLTLMAILVAALTPEGRACAAQSPAGSPGDDYVIQTWEFEDGLPGNSATAMVQTDDGYLWFGTFDGLVRFDGARFEVFDPSNTPGLCGAEVVNLHLDRTGRLWVSTLEGLSVRTGSLWRTLGPEDGWVGNYVRSFAERADGAILATTFDGRVLEWSGHRFAELPAPPGEAVAAMCAADSSGGWWVARAGFIGTWDGQRWNPMAQQPGTAGIGCAPSRDGGVWVLAGAEDLRKFRDGAEVLRLKVAGLPVGVWSLYEDSEGFLWMGTHDAGVCRIAPDGGWTHWDTESGLLYNSVRFVFEDRERSYWVGTSGGGLSRFRPRRVRTYGPADGIPERVVNSVWPLPDGGVLVGTYGKGLVRLTGEAVEPIPLPMESGSAPYVQSVLRDRSGRLWVGTFADGLFIIDASGVRRIAPENTGGGNVIAMFQDSTGRMWISGGESVAAFDDGEPAVHDEAAAIPVPRVCALAEDAEGAILLSNERGVFRFRGGAVEEVRGPEGAPLLGVMCLRPEPDGTLWMGTARAGLLRLQSGRLDVIDAADGLTFRSAYGILEDDHGYWWIATEKGVVRAAGDGLEAAADGRANRVQMLTLGVEDGKAGSECSGARQPVCGRGPDGRLWFATPKGVAVVDPSAFRVNQVAPPVLIESVSFVRPAERRPEGEAETRLTAPFSGTVPIPPGGRRLVIRYTGLSFASPGEVRFEIMMEGLEDSWRGVGSSRSVTYHDLAPGRYVFRVRAANDDGVWNEQGAAMTLQVMPFFWQARWFYGLIALIVIVASAAVAWGAAHARFRHKRSSEERFQRVVEAAPNAMILADAEGRISLVNAQAEREFGYERRELVGRPLEILVPEISRGAHADLRRDYLRDPAARAMGAGRELFGRRKDGSLIPVEIGLNPVRIGQAVSVLASITNVSERKQKEVELALQRRELAHLSRVTTLGELSGSLAHELNQPLTAILSNAQAAQRHMARERVDMQEVREILDDIVEQDKRAGEVIHRIRALFRKDEAKHQVLGIDEVIPVAIRLLRSDLASQGVEVRTVIAPDLPPVRGDRIQLQQVFLNLLINACDAMAAVPRGERSLEVRAVADGDTVRVSVADSGPGFPPGSEDQLFEPFFTTKAEGMGLGLAVCRTIIRSHGGHISAELGPAGGAVLCIVLPAAYAAPVA